MAKPSILNIIKLSLLLPIRLRLLCSDNNNPQRNPRSPKHRRTVPQPAQTKQSRERAQNTDLTRFSLFAYVLGARKGEGFY